MSAGILPAFSTLAQPDWPVAKRVLFVSQRIGGHGFRQWLPAPAGPQRTTAGFPTEEAGRSQTRLLKAAELADTRPDVRNESRISVSGSCWGVGTWSATTSTGAGLLKRLARFTTQKMTKAMMTKLTTALKNNP